MRRLTQVWNAITNTIMSYKLIQPAVNICTGIGTADLIANIVVYLQYRQIVV